MLNKVNVIDKSNLIDPTNINTAFHDFADGDGTYSVELSLKSLSLHVSCENLDALDGVMELFAGNYNDIKKCQKMLATYTLNATNFNEVIVQEFFKPLFLFVKLTANSVTSGKAYISIISKE